MTNQAQLQELITILLTQDLERIAEAIENLSESLSVEIKRLLFEASEAGGLSLGRDKRTNRIGVYQSRFDPPLNFDQAATILASHLIN